MGRRKTPPKSASVSSALPSTEDGSCRALDAAPMLDPPVGREQYEHHRGEKSEDGMNFEMAKDTYRSYDEAGGNRLRCSP